MQVHNREFQIESLYNERQEVNCLNTEQYACHTRNVYYRKSKVNRIDLSLLDVNKKKNNI